MWLIALVRTSSSLLNSSGESRYPCLVLRRSFQSFTTEYVNCGFFINAIYYTEEVPIYPSFLRVLP